MFYLSLRIMYVVVLLLSFQQSLLFYRLVALIHVAAIHGKYPHKSQPVLTTYANFVPLKPLVLTQNHAYVHQHTDTTVYFTQLNKLKEWQGMLESKVFNFTITWNDFPSFTTLSQNLDNIIRESSLTLISGIEALDHHPTCVPNTRVKRDLIRDQGILPGVGRALAWLTGTLTSDASSYINANIHNINKLQQSQIASLKVVNHTAHVAHDNAVQLRHLREKLNELGNKLNSDASKSHSIQLITSYYLSFTLVCEQMQIQIRDMVSQWTQATDGKLAPQALQGYFFENIAASLDENTLGYNNLKLILKKLARTKINACQRHVWLQITLPLLDKDSLQFFRVHDVPVTHNGSHDLLMNQAHAVAWSDTAVFEFTKYEFNKIVSTHSLSLSKPPTVLLQLHDSCLYALANNLTHRCALKHTSKVKSYVSLENNFLSYYFDSSETKVGIFKCTHDDPSPKQLVGSSVIYLPNNCKAKIDNTVFENTHHWAEHPFMSRPIFLKLDKALTTSISNASFFHEDYIDQDNSFNKDMESLQVASDLLGHFEIPTDHVVIFSMSLMLSTLILLILVIVIFLIICGPLKRCAPAPPVQVIQMRNVDKESL